MRWIRRMLPVVAATLLIFVMMPCRAAEDTTATIEIPYSLGQKKAAVAPGETFHAIFSIESTKKQRQEAPVEIVLPPGVSVVSHHGPWNVDKRGKQVLLSTVVALDGGYGQWFDLFTMQVDSAAVSGKVPLLIVIAGKAREVQLTIEAGTGMVSNQLPVLERVTFPLDRDGKRDEKQSEHTLVLRDRSVDYFKNVLRGKGAANLEIEAIHPVTHMGLDFSNPAGSQKLVMVAAELLDSNTHRPVPGLYTPGSSGDNDGAGAMSSGQDRLTAFASLNGDKNQRLQLPIYADETLLTEGKYVLRVTVDDGAMQVWTNETPVTVIKKNIHGVIVLGIGIFFLFVFFGIIAWRMPVILANLKTRRIITVALFGTCAFAVVNVPSTLLNDFFHIILGPFGFVITGMFSGIMLYMLTGALIVLIPQHGVATLMASIRLLLGMLAFGHMSPIVILSYGMNAFLLETALALTGITSKQVTDDATLPFTGWKMLTLALVCSVADTVATYISLQGMSVLYRLFFADWYIMMVMAVNGFAYTAIGAACGAKLGGRLSGVGSD